MENQHWQLFLQYRVYLTLWSFLNLLYKQYRCRIFLVSCCTCTWAGNLAANTLCLHSSSSSLILSTTAQGLSIQHILIPSALPSSFTYRPEVKSSPQNSTSNCCWFVLFGMKCQNSNYSWIRNSCETLDICCLIVKHFFTYSEWITHHDHNYFCVVLYCTGLTQLPPPLQQWHSWVHIWK